MLDRKGMEELSAWIFSTEQEDYVEQRIRLMLMEDSRINSQRKSFAEHGGWVLPKIFDINKEIF